MTIMEATIQKTQFSTLAIGATAKCELYGGELEALSIGLSVRLVRSCQ